MKAPRQPAPRDTAYRFQCVRCGYFRPSRERTDLCQLCADWMCKYGAIAEAAAKAAQAR